MRLAVTLVVPVLVAFALVLGAMRISGSEPQKSTWTPWGNRVVSSPPELAGWLAARGSNYADWARRHPAAAARLENRPVPADRSLAQIEPKSGTVFGDALDQVLLAVMAALVALVSLGLVLAGARGTVAPSIRNLHALGEVGSSVHMAFRDARVGRRGGGRRGREDVLGRRLALVPLSRAVDPVAQMFRALRWFYGTHRDEILWIGVGAGCAVVVSLLINR